MRIPRLLNESSDDLSPLPASSEQNANVSQIAQNILEIVKDYFVTNHEEEYGSNNITARAEEEENYQGSERKVHSSKSCQKNQILNLYISGTKINFRFSAQGAVYARTITCTIPCTIPSMIFIQFFIIRHPKQWSTHFRKKQ
jgi:hypothetical protein